MQITITAVFDNHAEAAAFLGANTVAFAPAPAAALVKKEATPVGKPTPATAPAPGVPTPPTAKVEKDAAPEKKAPSSVEYVVLQKAVFKLAAIPEAGRPACEALLATFGVKSFKELSEDRRDEALAAVTAKIAEIEAQPVEA